jgi:hypothetical protein
VLDGRLLLRKKICVDLVTFAFFVWIEILATTACQCEKRSDDSAHTDIVIPVVPPSVPQSFDAVEKVIEAGSLQTRRKNDAIRSPIHDRR